jgi:putative glycosyltransferase (TIGR04372 family)
MKVANNMLRKMRVAYSTLPTLTIDRLRDYYPEWISSTALKILPVLLRIPGKLGSKFVPVRACAFATSMALEFHGWEKAQPYLEKAKRIPESSKLIFHYELSRTNLEPNSGIQEKLLEAVSLPPDVYDKFNAAISWGFWNLSHSKHIELLERANATLEQISKNLENPTKRLLPSFTSNMGHLGFLTSYIGHYSVMDPDRTIVLWPDASPNKYFLDLVMNQSPLKISTMQGIPKFGEIGVAQRDSLSQSKRADNSWRIELCAGAYSGEDYFEVEESKRFTLKFPEENSDNCIEDLKRIGFDPNKWFVVLHVRDSGGSIDKRAQARDGEVKNYSTFCETINDLGGQVIRMGHNGFSNLSSQMKAIDYAHSTVRKEVIDCWLWSHCRWWTGTANGAAFAAFAFGATRLITDQWFWDSIGPSTDFFMPKLLSKSESFLSISETINHDLSREMGYYSKIPSAGLKLHSVPPDQLSLAALEMYKNTSSHGLKNLSLSGVEIELAKAIRNKKLEQTMRIPGSYSSYMEEYLPN